MSSGGTIVVDLLLVGAVSVYNMAWGDRLIGALMGGTAPVRADHEASLTEVSHESVVIIRERGDMY